MLKRSNFSSRSLQKDGFIQWIFLITLVLFLLLENKDYGHLAWSESEEMLKYSILGISIIGILFHNILFRPIFWLTALSLQVVLAINHWFHISSLEWLLIYWLINCFFCVYFDSKIFFEWNSRLILGSCMLLAVLTKLLSSEYTSGNMFATALYIDPRLEFVTTSIGGLNKAQYEANLDVVNSMQVAHFFENKNKIEEFIKGKNIKHISLLFTYGGLLWEFLIGMFALVFYEKYFKVFHTLLLGFLFIIYFFLPVMDFGWMLALIGLSLTEENSRIRSCYQLFFVVSFLYLLRLENL